MKEKYLRLLNIPTNYVCKYNIKTSSKPKFFEVIAKKLRASETANIKFLNKKLWHLYPKIQKIQQKKLQKCNFFFGFL